MDSGRANTIFRNGHVWAGDRAGSSASALAITDRRIVAVGEDDDVMNLSVPGTRVVDLDGQTLVPGFVDAHAHIWKIGHLLTTLLDVRAADSLEWIAERLRAQSKRLAPGAWLQGRGYNEARFPGSIRHQLGRVLGGGGFDPAADILGITVNRWPHGYACQYNSLADDFWINGGEQPCVIARRPYKRIAIANADAGAYSYTDAAIDHAHRAVHELLAG